PRLNLLPILPSSITIPRPPRPTLSPYTTLFRSSTLGKSIPCKKLCYINPIEQHPYFFLFRSQFMAMVKQMLKSQSFKQCRLCCFVFLSSANIFVVPFLGKCLDIVSSQMLVILVHKDSIHTR